MNDLQNPDQNRTEQNDTFVKISLAKYAVPENEWSHILTSLTK